MQANFLTAQIVKMQFAAGSDWAHCLALEKDLWGKFIDNWFANVQAEYLGIEVFLDLCHKDSCNVFAGVRVPASQENLAFAKELILAWQSAETFTLRDFLQNLDEKMSLSTLFEGEPDFMEMGIINLWNSFVPLSFWERGGKARRESFYEALSGAGRFKSFLPAPAAIESAFLSPIPHWLGYPVSKQSGEGHALSFEIIEAFFEGE